MISNGVHKNRVGGSMSTVCAHRNVQSNPSVATIAYGDIKCHVSLQMVTPEMAGTWLQHKRKNRGLKMRFIGDLVRSIVSGRWMFDGNPIRFNEAGQLLDGQNRLESIKRSGKPALCMVVEGVPDVAFRVIDSGTKRTGADTLNTSGYMNATLLAAAAAIVYRDSRHTLRSADRPSNDAILETLATHTMLEQSVDIGRTVNKNIAYPGGVAVALHYLASQYYTLEQADEFFTGLALGENLTQDSPIYRLRQIAINRKAGTTIRQEYLIAITIKAFKFFVANKKCGLLKFIDTEDFPEWID